MVFYHSNSKGSNTPEITTAFLKNGKKVENTMVFSHGSCALHFKGFDGKGMSQRVCLRKQSKKFSAKGKGENIPDS